MRDAVQVVLVELEGRRLGILGDVVAEVLPAVRITPIPGAPDDVEGVIDVRGTVVAVVDLRARFGLARRALVPTDRLVVVVVDGRRLALRVDDALDVVMVPAADIDRAAPMLSRIGHATGLVRLADGLVVICDAGSWLSSDEAEALEGALAAAGVEDGAPC